MAEWRSMFLVHIRDYITKNFPEMGNFIQYIETITLHTMVMFLLGRRLLRMQDKLPPIKKTVGFAGKKKTTAKKVLSHVSIV